MRMDLTDHGKNQIHMDRPIGRGILPSGEFGSSGVGTTKHGLAVTELANGGGSEVEQ
jgi:hypothetical protein